jgi:hypothetical protein
MADVLHVTDGPKVKMVMANNQSSALAKSENGHGQQPVKRMGQHY